MIDSDLILVGYLLSGLLTGIWTIGLIIYDDWKIGNDLLLGELFRCLFGLLFFVMLGPFGTVLILIRKYDLSSQTVLLRGNKNAKMIKYLSGDEN